MTLDNHLQDALREVQLSNARRINAIRAVGTGIFALIYIVAVAGFGIESWQQNAIFVSAYFVIALIIAISGWKSDSVARISRFAVPFFDMPVVFAIQLQSIESTGLGGQVSEFSVALFVTLIMLSTFTLSVKHIAVSLILAIIFEQILQHHAGIGSAGRIFSVSILCIASWICVFAGSNRLEMVKSVTQANARRLRLQRYFSPGVGHLLEDRDEDELTRGKECDLSILFVDIRGFTTLSDRLEVSEVVELLNAYHGHMVNAVFRCGGTLDKYLGDGLIAYFNAPVGQADHADLAVQCGLEMETELAQLNRELAEKGKDPLKIGIGIHTGRAIVGDIGAPHRREFTAIGSAVNVAARLESMTKEIGRTIVVSEATKDLVEGIQWKELGSWPIRGVAEPLVLFSPA